MENMYKVDKIHDEKAARLGLLSNQIDLLIDIIHSTYLYLRKNGIIFKYGDSRGTLQIRILLKVVKKYY